MLKRAYPSYHNQILIARATYDADAARQAMLEHLSFAEQRSTAYLTRLQQ